MKCCLLRPKSVLLSSQRAMTFSSHFPILKNFRAVEIVLLHPLTLLTYSFCSFVSHFPAKSLYLFAQKVTSAEPIHQHREYTRHLLLLLTCRGWSITSFWFWCDVCWPRCKNNVYFLSIGAHNDRVIHYLIYYYWTSIYPAKKPQCS